MTAWRGRTTRDPVWGWAGRAVLGSGFPQRSGAGGQAGLCPAGAPS